jgi:hypothetical protein
MGNGSGPVEPALSDCRFEVPVFACARRPRTERGVPDWRDRFHRDRTERTITSAFPIVIRAAGESHAGGWLAASHSQPRE